MKKKLTSILVLCVMFFTLTLPVSASQTVSYIQRMLGIGKSKAYTFLEDVYKQKNPPFRVLKIGKLFRVPKKGFDEWLNGDL